MGKINDLLQKQIYAIEALNGAEETTIGIEEHHIIELLGAIKINFWNEVAELSNEQIEQQLRKLSDINDSCH